MNFMKGFVTYVSAGLMVVTGLLQVSGVNLEFMTTSVTGWDLVLAGAGVFGVGRKLAAIEKGVSK